MVEEIQLGYGRVGCNFNRGAGVPGVTVAPLCETVRAKLGKRNSHLSVSLFHLFSLAAQRSSKTVAQPILAGAEMVPHISFLFCRPQDDKSLSAYHATLLVLPKEP